MTRYQVTFGNPAREPTVTVGITAETERDAIVKARQLVGKASKTVRVRPAKEGTTNDPHHDRPHA